jgi:meiotically up-regulated gene 157 (Mug157) protein
VYYHVYYHLRILQQIYGIRKRRASAQHWAKTEMHSIVFNLYSALDSLGYEINLAYGFRIDSGNILIHHRDKKKLNNKCLRCRVKK